MMNKNRKMLAQKGKKYYTNFYGNDDGTWNAHEGYILGFHGAGYNWEMITGISSENKWKNYFVEGATEQNAGFRKALNEIVIEYPELTDFVIKFDGPYKKISDLVNDSFLFQWEELVFYHGTNIKAWELIQKEGLRPRSNTNVKPAYGTTNSAPEGRIDAVYLTTQIQMAHFAANDAARTQKSEPVVLRIQGLNGKLMAADADSGEIDPKKSLARIGSVAYIGTIPPDKISLYEVNSVVVGSRRNRKEFLYKLAELDFQRPEIGLMTKEEFIRFKNPEGKHHGREAYDFGLNEMNRDHSTYIGSIGYGDSRLSVLKYNRGYQVLQGDKMAAIIHNGIAYFDNPEIKNKIPTVVFGHERDGINIDIQNYQRVKYLSELMPLISPIAKINEQRYPIVLQHIKANGEPMTIRAEASPQKNKGVSLAIFNSEGWVVANASNEWGATLLTVAREYRGKGIGKLIGHYWYTFNPDFKSGGFTEAGERNAIALWEERVREFQANGWYSELVRRGKITIDRVKQIVQGVGKNLSRPQIKTEPKVEPSGDILIFSDDITFVIYDKNFLDTPSENLIYGFGFFRDANVGAFIYRIEYDRPYAELTTKVALQMAKDNGDKLYNGEGYHDLIENVDQIPGVIQEGNYIEVTRDLLPLKTISAKERRVRKSKDPYNEKYYLLIEMAESKW